MAQAERLFPLPFPETEPFWEGCRRHELLVPRCLGCGAFRFFPGPLCPRCWFPQLEWVRASGKGTLYSYVISHSALPNVEEPPVILAVVELEEGLRLLSFLRGLAADLAELSIGMDLEVAFEEVDPRITVPTFRPASSR